MKKIIIPIIAIAVLNACNKTEHVSQTTENSVPENVTADTLIAEDNSSNNVPVTDTVTNGPQPPHAPLFPDGPTDKVIITDEMIYSDYPADDLPMEKLEREITNEKQVVYVKLQNAKAGENYFVKAEHTVKGGNIAIPHVYGPGMQDGPFGNETTYKIPKDGDYTFAFTKNTRAEGKQTGKILITLSSR